MKTTILLSLLFGLSALGAGFLAETAGELMIAGWLLVTTGLLLFIFYAVDGRPTP